MASTPPAKKRCIGFDDSDDDFELDESDLEALEESFEDKNENIVDDSLVDLELDDDTFTKSLKRV